MRIVLSYPSTTHHVLLVKDPGSKCFDELADHDAYYLQKLFRCTKHTFLWWACKRGQQQGGNSTLFGQGEATDTRCRMDPLLLAV